MRHALLVLGALAGCGRIDFDPTGGACTDRNEPNDTTALATPVALGSTIDAALCPSDVDVYSVTLAAGDELQVDIATRGAGWPSLAIANDAGPRAVPTYGQTLSAFADRDTTYYVTVAGVAAAAGTPYQLTINLRGGHHVFVAPNGNDAAPGTFAEPWQHLPVAVSRLAPGDVLVLEDGSYTAATTGLLRVDCSGGASNGSEAAPIRVSALTERRARTTGDGMDDVDWILACSWWTVEGLLIENVDVNGPTSGGGIFAFQSSNVVFRRLLVRHPNGYANAHAIDVNKSSNVLVEESETYDFHRAGVIAWESNNITLRRNFAASRGRADIFGGYVTDVPSTGDYGIFFGKTSNSLAENNIEEGNGGPRVSSGDILDSRSVHLFGNVARASTNGFLSSLLSSPAGINNIDTRLVDQVMIDSGGNGLYFRSNQQASCERCTAFRSGVAGWSADLDPGGARVSSASCTACLMVDNTLQGFVVESQDGGWAIDHGDAFGNGTPTVPATAPEITALAQTDPQLGGCLVYAPANSPMHGAAASNGDVGAQIVYRYLDGALTGLPLWDPITGAFTCGAVIPGINDDPATSCIGVHERLHVGTPDCALPY